jgi:hypothetical protein
LDVHVGGACRGLASRCGLAGEGLQSRCSRLLGVERETALVECLQVEGLAAAERGVVGEGDELAADDEGVADVDAGADHDQEGEREQQACDEDAAALVTEPAPRPTVHGELPLSRLR